MAAHCTSHEMFHCESPRQLPQHTTASRDLPRHHLEKDPRQCSRTHPFTSPLEHLRTCPWKRPRTSTEKSTETHTARPTAKAAGTHGKTHGPGLGRPRKAAEWLRFDARRNSRGNCCGLPRRSSVLHYRVFQNDGTTPNPNPNPYGLPCNGRFRGKCSGSCRGLL